MTGAEPDSPLLRAEYLEDVVMHDGQVMIRSGIFLSTAVIGDPVSVSVGYLPTDELKALAEEILGPLPDDDTEEDW